MKISFLLCCPLVSALLLAFLPYAPAGAASITLDDCSNDCGLVGARLHITGDILEGDAFDASMMIEPILDGNDRMLALDVDISQGDIAEALELGRMVRRLEMVVRVPDGARCFDPCLAILAGGVRRDIIGSVGLSGKSARTELSHLQNDAWFYFGDMHVTGSILYDWTWGLKTEEVFSRDDLERLGLTAVDPVWQTEQDVLGAFALDMPLSQYRARLNRMNGSGRMATCMAIMAPDQAAACQHDLLVEFNLAPLAD